MSTHHSLHRLGAALPALSVAAALAVALAIATPAAPAVVADSGQTTTVTPGPPTWPSHPRPIAESSAAATAPGSNVSTTSSGFDWGSAGIGAAVAAAGLFAVAFGASRINRRRLQRLRSAPTH